MMLDSLSQTMAFAATLKSSKAGNRRRRSARSCWHQRRRHGCSAADGSEIRDYHLEKMLRRVIGEDIVFQYFHSITSCRASWTDSNRIDQY